MKTIEVAKATNEQLNWLVAKCECPNDVRDGRPTFWLHPNNNKLVCRQTYNHAANPKGYELCRYSTNWAQGGPIIGRARISLDQFSGHPCRAHLGTHVRYEHAMFAPEGEPLVAAMRCYVASKLGEVVEVPEGLE